MTEQVAWGWSTRQAYNGLTLGDGKMVAISGEYWSANGRVGYSGFNGGGSTSDTKYMDDSRFMLGKVIEWLTGKTTGASVLILSELSPSDGETFSTQFCDGIVSHGHSFTRSGDTSYWGSYDPFDFDMMCVRIQLDNSPTWYGQSTGRDKFDYYLANGGKVLANSGPSLDAWLDDYGLVHTGVHPNSNEHDSPDTPSNDYQWPVTGSKVYPGGTIYVVTYTGAWYQVKGTDSMGGSDYGVDYCDATGHSGYGVLGWWEG